MVYKSKKEQYQAIVQFVGDLMTKNGMKKSDAVNLAMYKFNILTQATVYRAIRRCIEIHEEESRGMEVQDGQ